jgi:hypothetical protein
MYEKWQTFCSWYYSSATVGKYTTTVAGAAKWDVKQIGKILKLFGKIMVYRYIDVALKFAVAGGGSLGEIK